jgi:hypothetical protein
MKRNKRSGKNSMSRPIVAVLANAAQARHLMRRRRGRTQIVSNVRHGPQQDPDILIFEPFLRMLAGTYLLAPQAAAL